MLNPMTCNLHGINVSVNFWEALDFKSRFCSKWLPS